MKILHTRLWLRLMIFVPGLIISLGSETVWAQCNVEPLLEEYKQASPAEKVKKAIKLYSYMGKTPSCNQQKHSEIRQCLQRMFRQANNRTMEAKLLLVDAINQGHSVEKVGEKSELLHKGLSLLRENCSDSACRDVRMDIIINLGYTNNVALRYDSVVYYSLRSEELIDVAPRVELKVKAYLLCVGAYMIQNQFDKSLSSAQKAYFYSALITGPTKMHLMATAIENLSYQHFINHNLDSALFYANVALSEPEFLENMKFKQNMFARKGYVYYEKGDYSKYLESSDSSLHYALLLGDETLMAVSYQQYANALDRNKRFPEAIKAADQSFALSIKLSLTEIATEALRVKMAVLEQTGNFREALDAHKYYYYLRDSLSQLKNEAAAEKMKLEFEAEKKDLDILQLSSEKLLAEKKRQNQFIIFLAAVLFLLLIALWFWMRQRRKTLEKQLLEKELAAEHNRIGQVLAEQENKITNAELETSNRERKKISDALSQTISESIDSVAEEIKQLKLIVAEPMAQNLTNGLDQKVQKLKQRLLQLSADLAPVNTEPESYFSDDLRIFIQNFFIGKSLKVKIRLGDESVINKLDNDKKVLVYKILQEALANIIRHAGAKIINIDIYPNADWLNISVEDNGKGFVMGTNASGSGIGNLKSLIANQGGIFNVKSNIEMGTKLTAVIPLPQNS